MDIEALARRVEENNIMLKEILRILYYMNSDEARLMEFSINVSADLFVENLLKHKNNGTETTPS